MLTHSAILATVHNLNYWMRHTEGDVYLHSAPMFHIVDFPMIFAAPAFGTCQVTIPKFSPQCFCETVERERVQKTILVPTMINLLTQYPELGKHNLATLEGLAYGGSPMAPELIHRTRQLLPNVQLLQLYGLTGRLGQVVGQVVERGLEALEEGGARNAAAARPTNTWRALTVRRELPE